MSVTGPIAIGFAPKADPRPIQVYQFHQETCTTNTVECASAPRRELAPVSRNHYAIAAGPPSRLSDQFYHRSNAKRNSFLSRPINGPVLERERLVGLHKSANTPPYRQTLIRRCPYRLQQPLRDRCSGRWPSDLGLELRGRREALRMSSNIGWVGERIGSHLRNYPDALRSRGLGFRGQSILERATQDTKG
jgi:hypothetical protein